MKTSRLLVALVLVCSGLLSGAEEVVDFGRFGPVTLYRSSGPAAQVMMLPKVGHGFMGQQSWMPQFKQAFGRITSAPPVENQAAVESLQDLPLIEVPAKGAGRDVLGVLLTGDGGWAVADRGLSNDLAAAGVSVVALNSLKYFWDRKTPEESASALGRILRHYLAAWNKKQAVLIGYSLGADVLPFLMNRLPEDVQAAVGTVVLMGPSASAEFEFHVGDWLGRSPGRNALPVIPEIQKIRPSVAILCVYGEGDKDQICGALDARRVKSVEIPGGHRLGGGYGPVAAAILASLKEPQGPLPDLQRNE